MRWCLTILLGLMMVTNLVYAQDENLKEGNSLLGSILSFFNSLFGNETAGDLSYLNQPFAGLKQTVLVENIKNFSEYYDGKITKGDSKDGAGVTQISILLSPDNVNEVTGYIRADTTYVGMVGTTVYTAYNNTDVLVIYNYMNAPNYTITRGFLAYPKDSRILTNNISKVNILFTDILGYYPGCTDYRNNVFVEGKGDVKDNGGFGGTNPAEDYADGVTSGYPNLWAGCGGGLPCDGYQHLIFSSTDYSKNNTNSHLSYANENDEYFYAIFREDYGLAEDNYCAIFYNPARTYLNVTFWTPNPITTVNLTAPEDNTYINFSHDSYYSYFDIEGFVNTTYEIDYCKYYIGDVGVSFTNNSNVLNGSISYQNAYWNKAFGYGEQEMSINCTDIYGFEINSVQDMSIIAFDTTTLVNVSQIYPSNGAILTAGNITFNWSVNSTYEIDYCNLTLNGTNHPQEYPRDGNYTSFILGAGYYIWNMTCVDTGSNYDWTPTTWNFTLTPSGYCGTDYSDGDGDWYISSDVHCDFENVNLTGDVYINNSASLFINNSNLTCNSEPCHLHLIDTGAEIIEMGESHI